jgi:DNA-binding PadR family transcriptional regulator
MYVKVGNYEIPDMRLHPTLYEATKLIYEKFKSDEVKDMNLVATLLGHKSANSGSFYLKLAQLRAYGLIEKRGVKVTDIGKKLTYGITEEEKNEALKAAILNIPLWKEFYSRWGVELPNGNFWVDLAKITGLEAPDAKNVVETVRKAYLEDVRYLKAVEKPKEERFGMAEETKIDTSVAISKAITPVEEQAEIVKGLIKQGAFEIAKEFIDFIKAQKEEKPKQEETQEES